MWTNFSIWPLLPLREHMPHLCSEVSASLFLPKPLLHQECPPSPLVNEVSFLSHPKAKFKCHLHRDGLPDCTLPPTS